MRTRVKICGLTRPEDAAAAAQAGADAIGLVFYEPSPRNVSLAQAHAVVQQLPPFVSVVALFVDADEMQVRDICEQLRIDVIQFHGNESARYCESFDMPYIKAVRVRNSDDITRAMTDYSGAGGILIDSFDQQQAGGTGKVFDWSLVPAERPKPLILAGGLNPDNVQDAVQAVQPWAVDVSSGVEQAKGIKDPAKIEAFIKGVSNVDKGI